MDGDRYAAIMAAIGKQADIEQRPVAIGHVCRACVQVVGVGGVSFCVVGDVGIGEPIYATDSVSERAIELEITVGDGPGLLALDTGEVVLAGDLTGPDSGARWPLLVPLLLALGVRAVFAIPVVTLGVPVGVLELYRVRPEPLTIGALADGCLFADFALALLAGAADEPIGNGVDGVLSGSLAAQWTRVYQAVGIVSAQLETGVMPAFLRLRAHAFLTDCPLRQVADAVLDGRLRFTW